MKILWKYLRLQRWLIAVSLALAGTSQLLSLVDPIIFGKIIDDFATGRGSRPEDELVRGVLFWLALAVAVALLARLFQGLQEYLTRMAVARFGMNVFNDGLRQTLRLSFQEFEESRSGETVSVMQKVQDRHRAVREFPDQRPVLVDHRHRLPGLVQHHEELAAGPRFPHRHRRAGISHRAALEEDQDRPALHQPRNLPPVGGHHRVPAEHRAGQMPGPDLPGDQAAARSRPARSTTWR